MPKRKLTYLFIGLDWFAAIVAWAVFFYIRKTKIEQAVFDVTNAYYLGLLLVPFFWLFIFAMQGTYVDVRRLYRMKVLNQTFFGTLLGSIILFFALLLDDDIKEYSQFYDLILWLFAIHFTLFSLFRFAIVSAIVKRIHSRKAGFKTVIIGTRDRAEAIFNELHQLKIGSGHQVIGFIAFDDNEKSPLLTDLGTVKDLEWILREHNVEGVIIAADKTVMDRSQNVINRVEGSDIRIDILPDMTDISSGKVKMNNIFGAILIEVNAEVMPVWQVVMKRIIDVVCSLIAIILCIPLYIVLAILVKISSDGPIFFMQERIGKGGKPFKIIKFRTMYSDAEKLGPQLSSSHDPRITPIGRIMRKLRLDEFPQFFNVLKGEMSLVGPRPERQYFIDQITAIEPQFIQLTKVRPGITSWGQVKYGYAENVDQMLQRMKFDLLYMKNRTLALDFKIMLYTVLIVVKAKGK